MEASDNVVFGLLLSLSLSLSLARARVRARPCTQETRLARFTRGTKLGMTVLVLQRTGRHSPACHGSGCGGGRMSYVMLTLSP